MVDKLSDKQIYEHLKGVNEQVYDCIVDEDISALNGIIEGVESSGIMDLPNYNDVAKYYRFSEAPFFFGGVSFSYKANEMLDPFIAYSTNGYDSETIRRMHEDDFFAFMVNLENGEMPKKLTPREEAYIKFKEKMEHLYEFDGVVASNDLIMDDLAYIKILTDRVYELIQLKQKLPKNLLFYIELAFYLCIPGSKEIEKFLNLHGYSFSSELGVLEGCYILGKCNVRYKDLRRWIDIGLSYNTINKLMGYEIQIPEVKKKKK